MMTNLLPKTPSRLNTRTTPHRIGEESPPVMGEGWGRPSRAGIAYMCMYTCINICMYLHIHTCMYTYLNIYIHTYIHTCMHACMHAYIHTYIHKSHVCLILYIYIYIYMYAKLRHLQALAPQQASQRTLLTPRAVFRRSLLGLRFAGTRQETGCRL